MTQDQIIEWAREACLEEAVEGLFYASSDGLTRFAVLVAKHEREQCALACTGEYLEDPQDTHDDAYDTAINHCVAAIRARGEKPEPPHGWSAERYAKYQADVRDAGDKP